MRIKILSDGRVLEGTAEQIVQQMQYLAFGQEDRSLGEYVDWLKAQVERMESISLDVHGDTGPEKAKSLVHAMLESGLAEKA